MTKKDNVLGLPNANLDNAALEQFKRVLPELIAQQPHIAAFRFASFKEHVAAGFTSEQALELCKHPTLVPAGPQR